MIRIENLFVSRKGVNVLKDINISIQRGEFVAVIGPNGAGKTTLLDTIDGLIIPEKGSVYFYKSVLSNKDITARRRIGYVFQDEYVKREFPIRVLDVIQFGRLGWKPSIYRINEKDREAIEKAVKEVGIEHLLNKDITRLSGGEKRKVSIAREISREIDILLLDEVLANLDPVSQMEINSLIQRIHSSLGITILFVTHLLYYLPNGINRVIGMKDGMIMFDLPIDKITIKDLELLYGFSDERLLRYVGTFRL